MFSLFDDLLLLDAVPDRAAEVAAEVITAYNRDLSYHNTSHIHNMLVFLEQMGMWIDQQAILRIAVWYHDVVYDPKGKNNEEHSAALARTQLCYAGITWSTIASVSNMVLATKHHYVYPNEPTAEMTGWLLDADLSILCTAPPVYDEYALAIREEYAHVSDENYVVGRCTVLKKFLDQPGFIYHNLGQVADAAARLNITRELEYFGCPPS